MKRFNNHIRLRRAWISQLYREHDSICWQYGVKLKKPIIEINDSVTMWGAWDAGNRTLKLSARLVMDCSWDVVINVLKHEMAHQIVTELYHEEDGHGVMFGKACDIIGVLPEFQGASGNVPKVLMKRHMATGSLSGNEGILRRVKKLLALAGSNNAHEAVSAMEKANQLIRKYNIERIEQEYDAHYIYTIINHKKKRIENYQRRICALLMDYFFVEIVLSRLFDARSGETYRTIEIVGTEENAAIAEYVYFFLIDRLKSLWKKHQRQEGVPGAAKRSYWLGVLKGFEAKLHKRMKKDVEGLSGRKDGWKTSHALVCAADRRLAEFLKVRFPRIKTGRFSPSTLDRGHFMAGIEEGKRLTLNKGVRQQDGNLGKMLSA